MALSLSPHQLVTQVICTPLSNIPPQSYSTPKKFTTLVHDRQDHETLSMDQTESPLANSALGNVTHDDSDTHQRQVVSPSQAALDLPSWTPLRTLGDDEGPQPEAEELSAWKATDSDSTMDQHRGPTTEAQAQAPAQNTVTAEKTSPDANVKSSRQGKKVLFEGVFIPTKPPFHKKHTSRTNPRPAPTSSPRVLSLVDALARTFDANRHTEGTFPHRSHTTSHQQDDASMVQQTDVETTEAEDETPQLNTRLARTTLKRRHTRANAIANASESNSEDATSLVQDVPQVERVAKRLRPIQYESNPTLIDAALGTIQAPIDWDAELDFITRDEDFIISPAQTVTAQTFAADVRMAVDEANRTAGSPGKGSASRSALVENKRRMLVSGRTALSPYQSRGAKFRQRLDAIFGENATVRTDRAARPRPADLDFFTSLDEPDREPSSNTSEPAISVSSASIADEDANAVPSTRITSQSPDIPPSEASMDRLLINKLNDVDLTKPTLGAGEEQMNGWITALQRLIKGKIQVKEMDLEMLSVILAEIESVKDGLDEGLSTTSELRESVKRLSELHEIPFGDRNKLRQRAESILHTWPSLGNQELSDVLVH